MSEIELVRVREWVSKFVCEYCTATVPGVVHFKFVVTAVNDVFNSIDCERGFSDVC